MRLLSFIDHTAYKDLYPAFNPLMVSKFDVIVSQDNVKFVSDAGLHFLQMRKQDVIDQQVDVFFPDLCKDILSHEKFFRTRLRIPHDRELKVYVDVSLVMYDGVDSHLIKVMSCGAPSDMAIDPCDFLFQSADVLLVQSIDRRIIKINHAFERMYGWNEQELIGKTPPIVPHDLEKETEALLKILKKGIDVPGYETIRLHKNGRELHVSMTSSPIFDTTNRVIAIVSIMRDITKHMRTEQEFSKSVTELKRVQQRLKEREKLSIIGTMAAGMAHEIRNPLTAIQGFVKLIGDESKDNPIVSRYVQVALSEAKRANQILVDFLQLARPRSLVLQTVSLWSCVHEVVVSLGPQALRKNVHIYVEPSFDDHSFFVRLDENQMKQVLVNLGQNAIEACTPHNEVKFCLYKNEEKKEILLEVRDTGSGIAPYHLGHLDVPFFSTKQGGTGLGLSISYAIIEAHEGQVEVDSTLGEGTIFRIHLKDQC